MIQLINFLLLGVVAAPTEPATPTPPEAPLEAPLSPTPIDIVPGYEGAFLKMFLVLIALIVGIFITVWLLKKLSQGRWAHGNSNRSIKIIEKRPLSPKTMLYIIDVDGQQSVIAESQLEVKHIMNIQDLSAESKEK